jgi:hypothetical protein
MSRNEEFVIYACHKLHCHTCRGGVDNPCWTEEEEECVMVSTERIHVFAFVMLCIFLSGALAFLVLTFVRNDTYITKRIFCVEGQGSLVWPGPGAPSAATYCQGVTQFDRSNLDISWHWINNLSSPVTAIRVYGPVYETNPLNGPLYLTMCEAGTLQSCLFNSANSLSQRIEHTLSGAPLGAYVTEITTHPDRYIARVATEDFPDGEVAMKFNSLC